jgi:hypothetical protein
MEARKLISDLVPDVLSNVTELLHFTEIYCLLLIGNVRFTSLLLQNGSVGKLNVEMQGKNWNPRPCRSLLFNRFRFLRSLTLPSQIMDSYEFEPTRLPHSLTELNMEVPELFCRISAFNVGEVLPNLQKWQLPIVLRSSMEDWISSWPSSLVWLASIEFDFMIDLPPSLTFLRVRYQQPRDSFGVVKIPPSLIEMELSIDLNRENLMFLSYLPQTLRILKMEHSYEDYGDNETTIMSLLPRNLTHLKIRASLPKNDISGIPPHLTRLSLREIDVDQISMLPLSLKRFRLDVLWADRADFSLNDFLGSFPPELTRLKIRSSESGEDLAGQIRIPSKLEIWRCGFNFVDEAALLSLPTTLKSFTSGNIDPFIRIFPIWPHLIQLRVYNTPFLPEIANHLACHSPLLETIEIDHGVVAIEGFNSCGSYRSHTDPNALSRFEKISQFFDPALTTGPIYRFSERLRQFYISDCDYLADKFISEMLPRSIQTLEISNSFFLSNLGIRSLSHWLNLDSLCLQNSHRVTSECFKHLPRNLRTLNLAQSEHIWDQDFGDLPRSLTHIVLDSATDLTDACAPFLPGSTVSFFARNNAKITANFLQLLPESGDVKRNCTIFAATFYAKNSVVGPRGSQGVQKKAPWRD